MKIKGKYVLKQKQTFKTYVYEDRLLSYVDTTP